MKALKTWVPSSGIHSSICVIVVWSFSCRVFTETSKKFSRYAEAVWQFDWAAAMPDWFITGRPNVTRQQHCATGGEWLTDWITKRPGSSFPCSQKPNHLSLSWARWINSMPSSPVSLRSMLMFPAACLCLGLSSGLFTFQILYIFFYCPIYMPDALFISLSMIWTPD